MSYRTQGWTVVAGHARDECENLCGGNKGCKAYSYRARDKLCLLGPKGIVYSEHFNYYEKKGLKYEPFPILPPGAGKSCTGSLCAPSAHSDPTNNPTVKAMEAAEKLKMAMANG